MEGLLTIIYGAALGVGLLYAAFQVFAQGVDGALDIFHIDLGIDIGGDSSLSMLALSWFVAAFGAGGLMSQQGGAEAIESLAAASVLGIIIGVVGQILFVTVLSRTNSSEVRQESLIGKIAEISTPIPPNGVGQVLLVTKGSRVTYSARAAKHGESIPRGNPSAL
ncbi:MAG: YqiJ family protein [Anaerolineae bacterium]|nr:YqiJ family protein [Anaerolineae bacterium]